MLEWMRRLERLAPDGAGGGGGNPAGGPGAPDPAPDGGGDGGEPFDFAKWLAEQPEAVRKAHEDHVAGLKSALDAERKRAKELEKAQRDRDKAAEEEERKRLEEAGEFKELAQQAETRATKAEARVAELEPLAERVAALEGALKGYLDAEREGLAPHVLALLDKLDVVEQLSWIAANREVLRPQDGRRGVPPTPNADPKGKLSDEEKRKQAWKTRL